MTCDPTRELRDPPPVKIPEWTRDLPTYRTSREACAVCQGLGTILCEESRWFACLGGYVNER